MRTCTLGATIVPFKQRRLDCCSIEGILYCRGIAIYSNRSETRRKIVVCRLRSDWIVACRNYGTKFPLSMPCAALGCFDSVHRDSCNCSVRHRSEVDQVRRFIDSSCHMTWNTCECKVGKPNCKHMYGLNCYEKNGTCFCSAKASFNENCSRFGHICSLRRYGSCYCSSAEGAPTIAPSPVSAPFFVCIVGFLELSRSSTGSKSIEFSWTEMKYRKDVWAGPLFDFALARTTRFYFSDKKSLYFV